MFTLNDILQGNEDKVYLHSSEAPDPYQVFPSAQHDSRQVGRGDLFIAIRGAQVDGHRYISEAAKAGAKAALCNQPANDAPPDFLQIIVPDVIQALHATARVRTQRQKNTILIGITGSNGKTSTKEATAAVLNRLAPTLKTFASYNNEIGYPLTWLCNTIARPNWAIITNVGAAHLEYFGTQERVALAKSELVRALTPEGIALLNYDDVNVRNMSAQTTALVLYYGLSQEAEVRGRDIQGDTLRGLSFTLSFAGQQKRVQLHLPGTHGVMIALAAAAAGCATQMSLDEIGEVLEALSPAKGRCEIKPGPTAVP